MESLPFVMLTPACKSSIPVTLREAEFPISSAPTLRTEFVALFSINLFSPTIVTVSPSTAEAVRLKSSGVVRSTLTETLDSELLWYPM